MSELKKRIGYTVACVSEFAERHGLTEKDAFLYLYEHKGMEFLRDFYDVEHTLGFADAVDDLATICRNNGGNLA